MTTEELEPLTTEIEALIAADRDSSPVPEGVRQRTMRRVEWTLAAGPAGGGSDGGNNAGDGPGNAVPDAATTAAAGGLTKIISVGVVAFALGGAAGAGIHASVTEHQPTPLAPQPLAITSITPTPPTLIPSNHLSPMVTLPSRTTIVPPNARPSSQPIASADEPVPERDTDLAAERALLVEARQAMSAGNSAGALDAVNRHASRFPAGRLGQEREVIAIRALVAAGRVGEARARAQRFKTNFPKSMALPAIDTLLGTNP